MLTSWTVVSHARGSVPRASHGRQCQTRDDECGAVEPVCSSLLHHGATTEPCHACRTPQEDKINGSMLDELDIVETHEVLSTNARACFVVGASMKAIVDTRCQGAGQAVEDFVESFGVAGRLLSYQ